MPRDPGFDENMRHKVLDFRIGDIAFIIGEGVPRIEITCTHIAAPVKKKITIYPAADSATVASENDGRTIINTTISPSLYCNIKDLEDDTDVKKE